MEQKAHPSTGQIKKMGSPSNVKKSAAFTVFVFNNFTSVYSCLLNVDSECDIHIGFSII